MRENEVCTHTNTTSRPKCTQLFAHSMDSTVITEIKKMPRIYMKRVTEYAVTPTPNIKPRCQLQEWLKLPIWWRWLDGLQIYPLDLKYTQQAFTNPNICFTVLIPCKHFCIMIINKRNSMPASEHNIFRAWCYEYRKGDRQGTSDVIIRKTQIWDRFLRSLVSIDKWLIQMQKVTITLDLINH